MTQRNLVLSDYLANQGGMLNGNLNEGYIVKFLEKPTIEEAFSNVINAGLYIIEPEMMDYVPHGYKVRL